MKAWYDTEKIRKKLSGSADYFDTFLDCRSLAAGIICLDAGQEDTQEPHDSDEAYYIVRGDGFLKVGSKKYRVVPGRIFFVARGIPHRFFGNKKELVAVYFFGA